MKAFGAALLALVGSSAVWADTIHLKSGGTLEGVILKRDQDGVVVLLKYATVTIGSFEIESVERVARPEASTARMARWEHCYETLVGRPWGPELELLPARVIDSGPFKNVPYVVRASDDYQFSLYGDPDAPACLELGVSGAQLARESAQKECRELLASFLLRSGDADAVRGFALVPGKKDLDGLEFEISQAPDSRGHDTWWISISDPAALEAARVSDRQLESLASSAPSGASGDTTVASPARSGGGEKQEVISPFGTEPNNNPPPRRSYGTGGYLPRYWGSLVRWHAGHVSTPKK